MLKKSLLFINLLAINLVACAQQNLEDQLYRPPVIQVSDTAMFVTFDNFELGNYTDNRVNADFKNIKWVSTSNRGSIVKDDERGNVLKVFYPKGSVGPQQAGIQFVRNLANMSECYLDYYLKFDKDFDFKLGGKLPGLTSGGDTYTGGVDPTNGDGWSARYMWTSKKPVVYLYYVDMADKYGESMTFNMTFEKGKWYRVTQHIKINDVDKSNAAITVYVDGKVVATKTNFRLRIGNKGMIDSFYFSTFHGGATAEWAPQNDSYIYFDNFLISTKPIQF